VAEQSRILESFFTHAQTCLVFLDRSFNFIRVNEAYAKACRRDVSEFTGRNHFELYPSDGLKAEFERVVQTREPFHVLGRPFIFPDHSEWGVTYWDLTLVPIQDDRGEVEFLVFSLDDVTGRKRSEEAVRNSENRYRTLVDNLPQRIFLKDQNSVYVSMNDLYASDLNVKAVEAAGKTDYDFFPKELAEKYRTDDARVMASGQIEEIDEEYIQEGQRLTIHMVKTPVRDQQGSTTGVLGIFWDITEQKRVRDALTLERAAVRESEARYRSLFENLLNGIAYCRMLFEDDRPVDFVYLEVNRTFGELTELKNVVGRRVTEVIPGIRQSHPEVFDIYGRVALTGRPERFEVYLKPLERWLAISVSSPRKGYFVAVFDNITERRVAEESLRLQSAALHAAADAIMITDRAGVIEWVNPAFTQLTGYTAEEALGKPPGDLVKSGKHVPAFFEELWETILARRTWRGEIINRRKDGSLYTERQTVTPILDASGAITHFVAIKNDITERLQLEAQYRQAQKMESVGHLASGIAHDFNNLLTVINGMSQLVLSEVSKGDAVYADVQEILHAGERAATLTRQLLAFSRQQILEPRVMNFNTVVARMESLLRRLLGEDIDLVVVPAPGLSNVKADPGQIEQVITNLAVNARDAMPLGGRLTIETQCVTIDKDVARQLGVTMPSGSYVLLAVSDSGGGMDEATRARIFEPFFTTKGPSRGTGLGLSTAYGIVKQSHGFIWAYSEVGQGTSFKIYLPQVTEAAGRDRPRPTVVSRSGTETILLAEDNAGLRKLAMRVLEPAGYTVLGAATAEEALRLLERHEGSVHLLLSDVVMPGMSGRQLAEHLAQTRPGLKVLYMSGYTSDTIVRHGVLEAQVPFLNKPFSAAALLQKVREVLDS
jgi:PAS domain S-box-containing protein